MAESFTRPRELNGWKEIARYLRVSVRTAQSLEKQQGLPVRRGPGMKAPVYALAADLETWKSTAATSRPPAQPAAVVLSEPEPSKPKLPVWRRALWVGAIVIVLFAALAAPAYRFFYSPAPPVRYQVEADRLRTFDGRGHLVWQYQLPRHVSPEEYTESKQFHIDTLSRHDRYGLFADIDGDGKPEFLFVFWPEPGGKSLLYCFRSDGKLLWTAIPGRAVTVASGAKVLDRYWIDALALLNHPRADGGRIVVSSHHAFSWPAQIAVLTPLGKQVAEYWHPGWIFKVAVADLDGDGVDEIILGGVNNGFSDHGYGATAVVLDSRSVSGQGPVPEGDLHQIQGIPAGQESAVLLFPEFGDTRDGERFCRVAGFNAAPGYLETVIWKGNYDYPYVHYELDQDLKVVNVTPALPYEKEFLDGLSPKERSEQIKNFLSRVRELKNRFATVGEDGGRR